MKDKITWLLLSKGHRSKKKLDELARDFEKKKSEVDLLSDEATRIMNSVEKATKRNIALITYIDEEYPEDLKAIAQPPAYFYARGNVGLLKHPLKITMVGSRECTLYGMKVASDFAFDFAKENMCVVSGGAKGIDAAAMRGALKAGGSVIAVIGTGINIDYPKENSSLFKEVEKKGVIISEYDWDMGPLPHNFPARNRIMTALGCGVVVVEAAEKSGALISAEYAMEQDKHLFAVPGNIDEPTSRGTNNLLHEGAIMALSGKDVLYYLMEKCPDEYRSAKEYKEEVKKEKQEAKEQSLRSNLLSRDNLTPEEKAVLHAIREGNTAYEEIQEFCALETNKLTSVLTIMEIKGIIKLAFQDRYKLND